MPPSPNFQYDVFLSHDYADKPRVLLLCISPAVLASGWVAQERSTAVHRHPANAGRRFIPLLLGDCALPDTLWRYKVVNISEESDAWIAEDLTAWLPSTANVSEGHIQTLCRPNYVSDSLPNDPSHRPKYMGRTLVVRRNPNLT